MVTAIELNAAWAVVLTSTNDYVKGILALKHALHDLHHSQYPLLVLYTKAVLPGTVDVLVQSGCIVKEIDPIHPKGKVKYKAERFVDTWTKLAVWNQTDYDRLVLLDADMLPLQNMDELMILNLPSKDWIAASHACVCNPQNISHYPTLWVPANCAYTNAGKDANLDCASLNNQLDYFNSGLIVLIPDKQRFDSMVDYLHSISDLNIYPFPDQDFLNEIFKDKWKHLPYTYNALKTLEWCHASMWDIDHIKNLHYILTKPWDMDKVKNDLEIKYKPLYELWWHSYNSQSSKSKVNRDNIDFMQLSQGIKEF